MSVNQPLSLNELISQEILQPVGQEILSLCEAIRANRQGILAILFYGSGLWKKASKDTMYDFYILVENYKNFDSRNVHALLGRVLPPNVYYLELEDIRCKYAVMRMDQFQKAARGEALNSQIWARFAQPCRMPFVSSDNVTEIVIDALKDAIITFHQQTLPLLNTDEADPERIWQSGLKQTYNNEWRSERQDRFSDIYQASQQALEARTRLALPECRRTVPISTTGIRRLVAKTVYFLQLLKAALTFDGGIDYALWKIERQSGVKLKASELQRRHPLLTAWPLVWKAWRSGALR